MKDELKKMQEDISSVQGDMAQINAKLQKLTELMLTR
jgi:hypothetical protein